MQLEFDLSSVGTVAAGESVEIPFSGDVPAIRNSEAQIKVNFIKTDSNKLCSRTFGAQICSGQYVQYDESNPTKKREVIMKKSRHFGGIGLLQPLITIKTCRAGNTACPKCGFSFKIFIAF